jgi:ABC-type glycerol-3-phosphate transport system substrate-binding protein
MPVNAGFGSMNFFGGPLWSHGGDWANRTTDALTFHKPEGIAALEMWVNVAFRQLAAPTSQPADWQGLPGGPFVNGKVALAFQASEGMRALQNNPPAFRWTVVQMPRKSKPGAHYYSHGLFVTQGSREKEAAAEFVRVSALPDQIAKWNTVALGMPTTKASASHQVWRDYVGKQPEMRAFDSTIAYMRSYPLIARWNEASEGPEGIGQGILDAVQGTIAPNTALAEAARRASALLGVPVG